MSRPMHRGWEKARDPYMRIAVGSGHEVGGRGATWGSEQAFFWDGTSLHPKKSLLAPRPRLESRLGSSDRARPKGRVPVPYSLVRGSFLADSNMSGRSGQQSGQARPRSADEDFLGSLRFRLLIPASPGCPKDLQSQACLAVTEGEPQKAGAALASPTQRSTRVYGERPAPRLVAVGLSGVRISFFLSEGQPVTAQSDLLETFGSRAYS